MDFQRFTMTLDGYKTKTINVPYKPLNTKENKVMSVSKII